VPREIDGAVMHPLGDSDFRDRVALSNPNQQVQIEEPKRAAKSAA
jgi:hypothetical protein